MHPRRESMIERQHRTQLRIGPRIPLGFEEDLEVEEFENCTENGDVG